MSLDVEAELRERLAMTDQEFNQFFVVDEIEEDIVVAIVEDNKGKRKWLEPERWGAVNDYVKEKDGEWHKDKGCWTIPIESIKQVATSTEAIHSKSEPTKSMALPSGEPIPVVTEEPEDEAGYLRPTFDVVGELVPALVTPNGQVIDGKHRLALNPNWEKRILVRLNDPVKAAIARLVINVVRRQVPPQEKTELLTEIAKLTGWTPQQIAQSTGMSYRWVLKYLPDEFKTKEKVEVGALGGEATAEAYRESQDFGARRAAEEKPSEEMPSVPSSLPEAPLPAARSVECENCHIRTYFPKDLQGRTLCSRCYDKAKQQPEAFAKKIKKAEKIPEPKPKPKPSEIDVGEFVCPECGEKYLLIHVAAGKHRLRRIGKG